MSIGELFMRTKCAKLHICVGEKTLRGEKVVTRVILPHTQARIDQFIEFISMSMLDSLQRVI